MLSAGLEAFTYDGNGSLISRKRGEDAVKYSWNAAGRLGRVQQSIVGTQYAYDGLNRRLARLGPLATHNYVYEEGGALPTLLLQGTVPPNPTWKVDQNITDIFINGLGVTSAVRVGAREAPADVDYIHQDALGSTVAVTDTNGRTEQSFVYSPWGMQIGLQWPSILQNEQEIPFRFTGQITDPSDHLIYMRARYYDPSIGRFISRDSRVPSVVDAWDRNPYVYARNNPATFRDPSGRAATSSTVLGEATGSSTFYNSAGIFSRIWPAILAAKAVASVIDLLVDYCGDSPLCGGPPQQSDKPASQYGYHNFTYNSDPIVCSLADQACLNDYVNSTMSSNGPTFQPVGPNVGNWQFEDPNDGDRGDPTATDSQEDPSGFAGPDTYDPSDYT
jgi:RHS repeat-associated protein